MNEQQTASMMNQQQQLQQHMMCMSQGQMMNMNPRQQMQQPPMMNRKYGVWPQPPQIVDQSQMQFNPGAMNHQGFMNGKQQKPLGPRNTWKGKKAIKNDNRMDGGRRKEKSLMVGIGGLGTGGVNGGSVGGASAPGTYQPPTLNELQWQNRVKARKFFHKKKINNYNNNYYNNNNNSGNNRKAPFAPRNTTSFLIRAKKSGGIASLVSPCPVTPAVLPTPILSPSREVLVDMAKEEWGVDGYGSMKGLIRLRSPGLEIDDDEDQGGGGSSESDVEEHVEVERRLDHDLSRFEMIYPNCGMDYNNNILENRVDDQDSHIAHLEEENLILKERLFLMERELGDLRRRLHSLERKNHREGEENEVVMENESENDSASHEDTNSIGDNNNLEVVVENNMEGDDNVKGKLDTTDSDIKLAKRGEADVMETETLNYETVELAKTEEVVRECKGKELEGDDLNGKLDAHGDRDIQLAKKEETGLMIETESWTQEMPKVPKTGEVTKECGRKTNEEDFEGKAFGEKQDNQVKKGNDFDGEEVNKHLDIEAKKDDVELKEHVVLDVPEKQHDTEIQDNCKAQASDCIDIGGDVNLVETCQADDEKKVPKN
ncbi:unnamed protein product [Cuscuta epithymum]|uniref:PRLI-interacting factor A n=1 Tax=Cuscuta epithymum TaxID=186058 RepID=A0AAV0DNR1_9ASTE|nr:unnamed protein product [Cuscuta epithymum]